MWGLGNSQVPGSSLLLCSWCWQAPSALASFSGYPERTEDPSLLGAHTLLVIGLWVVPVPQILRRVLGETSGELRTPSPSFLRLPGGSDIRIRLLYLILGWHIQLG